MAPPKGGGIPNFIMNITLDAKNSAFARGIKTVGVGKKGSKPLGPALIDEIIKEMSTARVPEIILGAFWGSLLMKGLTEEEMVFRKIFPADVFPDPKRLVDFLSPQAPKFIKECCEALLNHKTFDRKTSYEIGKFLFSHQPGDAARGMIASILRVRYETAEEYDGLLQSMQETVEKPFTVKAPEGQPIIQMAEPFDGVDQSNMITPLVARHLQSLNYRVVNLVGRNSGPKGGINLLDITKALKASFLKDNHQLAEPKPTLGWYLNQEDLSKPIDRWVEFRRQIIKRPFLATLERFLNPAQADIMIASAFHAPYGEKMITVCEHAGFPGIIIVRNGMEGSIAFPLKRAVKILASARQADGSYKRQEIEFNSEEFLNTNIEVEEKITQTSIEANTRLIHDYLTSGQTGNRLFDSRVKVTCAGLSQALEWINKNLNK